MSFCTVGAGLVPARVHFVVDGRGQAPPLQRLRGRDVRGKGRVDETFIAHDLFDRHSSRIRAGAAPAPNNAPNIADGKCPDDFSCERAQGHRLD